jgi:formate dehydrogenase gamma subunit
MSGSGLDGRGSLRRFSAAEIAFHWSLVPPYLALGATGLLLLAEKNLGWTLFSRAALLRVHLIAGVAAVAGPALVLMASHPQPFLATLRAALSWGWRDLWWLSASALRVLLPRIRLPAAGRFNAGQKLNLLHVVLAMPVLAATGAALWLGAGAVIGVRLVHVGTALLSLALAAGHMYLAIVNPSTRKALGSIVHGRVAASYAAHHHPSWYEETTGLKAPPAARSPRALSRIGIALLALAAGASVLAALPSARRVLARPLGAALGPYIAEPRLALSPGPLHALHAAVPELARCSGCHQAASGVSSEKCLACHQEVARRMALGSGYHGGLRGECADCHADHRPEIIALDDRGFQHDLTRFRLMGAHRDLACDACHRRADWTRRRYLDLPLAAGCASCHEDPHRPGLERPCDHCHREDSWHDPAPSFDHGQDTAFPLAGGHAALRCSDCHRRSGGSGPPLLRGTAKDCAACHVEEAAAFGALAAARGAPHAGQLECAECHIELPAPRTERCSACHPPDYDALFIEWRGRLDIELLRVSDAARAAALRQRGLHDWEGVVQQLRSGREVRELPSASR